MYIYIHLCINSIEYQNQFTWILMEFFSLCCNFVWQNGLLLSLPYAVELGVLLTAGVISDYLINGGHLSTTNTRKLFNTTGNITTHQYSLWYSNKSFQSTSWGELCAVSGCGSHRNERDYNVNFFTWSNGYYIYIYIYIYVCVCVYIWYIIAI